MKRRVLCLYLPQWPIQRARGGRRKDEVGRRKDEGVETEEQLVVVLHTRDPRRGDVVAAASSAAQEAGVREGMPLAEVGALLSRVGQARAASAGPPLAMIAPHDAEADLAELARLAIRCERFSPIVGWETVQGSKLKLQNLPLSDSGPWTLDFSPPTGPDCLFLDVTGIGVLFGGEERLAEEISREVRRWGYDSRVAIADTIGAAWAAAKNQGPGVRGQGSGYLVLNPEYSAGNKGAEIDQGTAKSPPLRTPHSALRVLPLAALRLPLETIHLLNQLGIQQVDELLGLPRESLRARFGERLILRIDQFLGATQETIVAHRPPPQFVEEWLLEYPAEGRELAEGIVQQLVGRVACSLAERREGVLRLVCRLDCAPGQPLFLHVGLFRPSADAEHLWELVRMQLEQAALPGPLGRVRLEATLTAKLENRQGLLFAGDEHQAAGQFAQLIDRCNSRLGSRAVLQAELTADPLPEKAVRYRVGVRVQGSGFRQGSRGRGQGTGDRRQREASRKNQDSQSRSRSSRRLPPAPHSALCAPRSPVLRPLAVYSPPVPLNAVSIAPDGPPVWFELAGQRHNIAQHTGPERIETGWWRGKSVRRDYWRVQTTTGERFWLFRHLVSGQWQLHGAYE